MARYRVTANGHRVCLHAGPQDRVAIRKRNGVVVARAVCLDCSRIHGPDLGPGFGLTLVEDNVSTDPCARCGATDGVEYHHWAPRALFGEREATRWPGAYLCRSCHGRWHRTMNAERPPDIPAGA